MNNNTDDDHLDDVINEIVDDGYSITPGSSRKVPSSEPSGRERLAEHVRHLLATNPVPEPKPEITIPEKVVVENEDPTHVQVDRVTHLRTELALALEAEAKGIPSAGFVALSPDSTGKKVDTSQLVVGLNTVERQNVCIADPLTANNVANVSSGGLLAVDGSGVTQPVSIAALPALTAGAAAIGSVTVTGNVAVTVAATLPVSIAAAVAVTGTFFQATQPVSIATAPALVASSAIIGNIRIDQTTPGTTNGVQIAAAIPAGTNTIGNVGLLLSGAADGQTAAANQAVALTGFNGTSWDRLQVDASKFLKVNIAAGTVAATQSGTWNIGTVTTLSTVTTVSTVTAVTTLGTITNTVNTKSTNDATTTTNVPATASNLVVKASAGRLVSCIVTTAGSANLQFFDNSTTNSGTVLGIVPSTATVGQVFVFAMPAAAGITAAKSTTTPVVTVAWA